MSGSNVSSLASVNLPLSSSAVVAFQPVDIINIVAYFIRNTELVPHWLILC